MPGLASSSDGTKLAAVENDGYIYTSTDSGASWSERTNSGQRRWQSITSSSDGTKLAAVDSDNGYIYTSTDSGATWTERTSAGQRYWQSITSSSDGTKLAAVEFAGYIYTSTDSGVTWTEQTSAAWWYSVTSSADGTKLAAVDYNNGYIYTSTDAGATWTGQATAGTRSWQSIASSSDGTKLAAVVHNGYIYTSTDSGATWTEQTAAGTRSWQSIASSSDGTKLASVAYDGSIYLGVIEIATTPDTVTNLSTTRGNSQVKLIWNAPSSDGGSPITDYIVQYKLTVDSTWQTFADGVNDNTSVTVTGLDSNTSYDFRVAAKNDVGNGSFSSIVTVTTLAETTPPSTPPNSNTANLTTPTSPTLAFSLKPVSLTTPTGTTINSSSTVPESSLVVQDNNNQYPLGLVNFSFTTNQSSNQVVLNFITNLTPNQVTPRKYNPSTNTYTNLPSSANAVVSETTINNQHALVLTYTIIDNGELDLDSAAGTISDPIGLAVSNSTYDQLANTGESNIIIYLSLAFSLIVIASWLTIATRKRKLQYFARI